MQIVVKLLDGTSLNLEVDPQDTAATVKQKIADKSLDGGSISVDNQRLIFGGKQLADDESLDCVGVENGAAIHLIIRLRAE
jgi:hypothetical protein